MTQMTKNVITANEQDFIEPKELRSIIADYVGYMQTEAQIERDVLIERRAKRKTINMMWHLQNTCEKWNNWVRNAVADEHEQGLERAAESGLIEESTPEVIERIKADALHYSYVGNIMHTMNLRHILNGKRFIELSGNENKYDSDNEDDEVNYDAWLEERENEAVYEDSDYDDSIQPVGLSGDDLAAQFAQLGM